MGKAEYRLVSNVAVGSILFKGMLVEFAIDAADLPLVQEYKWHLASNTYIATTQRVDCSGATTALPAKKKELYLHTLLLSPGPGQAVQHISKNGLDNRRCNLRLVDASGAMAAALATAQATSKKRVIELPALCGIQPDEIPRHVWYVQANGYHGDRFAIELKTEKILWKTTSSKKITLQEKLAQAKAKLQEFYGLYPYLDPAYEEEQIRELKSSFEEVVGGVKGGA